MTCRSPGWKVATLTVVVLLGGCGDSPEEQVRNASVLEAAGDLPGAILQLKSAVQQLPDDGALRLALGRIYNRSFQPVQAEKELRAALRNGHAAGGETMLELARSLRAQGKFKQLVEDVSIPEDTAAPLAASLHALRGRARHALGDPEEAVRELEKARTLDAESSDAAMLDAQILTGKREYEAALAVLDRMLDRDPNYFDAWAYKAELLRLLRRPSDALAAYGKVLKLDPRNFTALTARTALLIGEGKLDEAAKDVGVLEKHYKGHPGTSVHAGMLDLANGRPKEALDSARAALKLAPELASATLLAGIANFQLGNLLQAEQLLTAHLAGAADDAYARRLLSETQLALEQPARALETLQPLLQQGTDEAAVYIAAANATTALGDRARAAQYLEKAASLNPEDAGIQIQRAIAKIGSSDGDVGFEELREALKDSKAPSRADEYLVLSLLQKGDASGAMEAVDAMSKREPDAAITQNLRGLVLLAKGDVPGASAAFEAALAKDPGFLPAARNLVQLDLASGDVAAARARYKAVAEAEDADVAGFMALGDFELEHGETAAARRAFERALQKAPQSLGAQKKLIAIQLSEGNTAAALEMAEKALGASPDDPQLIMLTANAQRAAGNTNQAAATIQRLIGRYGDNEQSHIRVAEFLAASGLGDEALATLRKALEGKPRSPTLQIALLSQLVALDRNDEAMAMTQSIQKAQPGAPMGDILEGEVHEAGKAFDKAATAYRRALGKQQVGELAVKLFLAEARAGNPDEALTRLRQWADKHPAESAAWTQIGDVLLGQGRYEEAAREYEKALGTQQASVPLLNNLAYSYQMIGDPRALSVAQAAYQAAPNVAMVADTLGWVLLQRDQPKEALPFLRRALMQAPDNPDIAYHLAMAQVETGDRVGARRSLELALKDQRKFASRADAEKLMESL